MASQQRNSIVRFKRENSQQRPLPLRHHFAVALISPKVRQLIKPSPEEEATRTQQWKIERAEREQKQTAARPHRRAAIESGPLLRNIDTAVECHCGCHPRPADIETHDGGISCPCQLTQAERQRTWSDFAAWEPDPEMVEEQHLHTVEFEAEVERLGVEASVLVDAAPFVIGGVVDRRAFYMRERGGAYRVTIAHDDTPHDDPWTSKPEVPTIDIGAGSESEFYNDDATFSRSLALRTTVQLIRSYLLRRDCQHERPADATHQFCRKCGIQLPVYRATDLISA